MSILVTIFKQTFWQGIGKIITSISTFIILGIIARNYKEEGVGIFTLSITYLAMFSLLGDFGFNAHVLRIGVKDWNKLLGTRMVWSVVLIIIALGILPFWPFATNDFPLAILFGSLAIAGSGIYISCNLIFQSKLRYDLSVLASSLGTIAGLVIYILLSSQHSPIHLLLAGYSFSWIIIGISSLLFAKKFLNKLTPVFNYQYAKSLFKDSWPIAATLALNVIYFRVDSFMIAYFKGISDAGIYNVAYSVFQSVLVLPTFIMNSYYPLMLKSLSYIRLVALGLIALAIIGSLFVFVLSPTIINILTGGGFIGSIYSLQILSLGFPAYFLSSLLMWVMVTAGKYKIMLIIYTLGLLFNLILNLIYIPQHSFLAAAWTTVISEYLILGMQTMVLLSRL